MVGCLHKVWSALCVFALGLSLVHCGSGSGSGGGGGEARYKVLHSLAGQANISVYFNSKVVQSSLGYAGSTGYLAQSGSVHIQIYDANSGTATLLADRTVSAGSGTRSTLLFTRDSSGNTALVLLPADDVTTPNTNQANVRFVNAALRFNPAAIDVYLVNHGTKFSDVLKAGPTVSIAVNPQGVQAGSSTEGNVASKYFSETSQQYDLYVMPGGSQVPYILSSSPALVISLGSEKNRTLVFLDPPSGGSFNPQIQTLDDLN